MDYKIVLDIGAIIESQLFFFQGFGGDSQIGAVLVILIKSRADDSAGNSLAARTAHGAFCPLNENRVVSACGHG